MSENTIADKIENSDEVEDAADYLGSIPEQQKEHSDAETKYSV